MTDRSVLNLAEISAGQYPFINFVKGADWAIVATNAAFSADHTTADALGMAAAAYR